MSNKDSSATEEEDDYGCYFLRPVNEYKIAEKIVEANRELFGEDYDPASANHSNSAVVTTELSSHQQHAVETGTTRRVQFRADLEDFEPDFITDDDDDDDDDSNTQDYSESDVDDSEVNENSVVASPDNDKVNMMLDSPRRRPQPAEIESTETTTLKSTLNNIEKANPTTVSIPTTTDTPTIIPSGGGSPVSEAFADHDDIEEICEVIDDFGLAESNECMLSSTVQTMVLTASSDDRQHRYHHDSDDDHQRSQSSESNRSGDSQEGVVQRIEASTTSSINPSKPRPKSSNQVRRTQRNHLSSSHSNHSADDITSSSSSSQHHHHNHHYNTHGVVTDDDDAILKIQLNFKPCCEFKNAEARRLPRYCGYVSQYGLSKEQLDRRDLRRERHHQRKAKQTENQAAEASNKSRVNEEAFARWLAVKMRTAQGTSTGSRNMYDYVPTAAARKKQSKK